MNAAPIAGLGYHSPDYSARIRRAQFLASAHSFATEVLTFYEKIAGFQEHLYGELGRRSERTSVVQRDSLRSPLNSARLLGHFPEMLETVERSGPEPVRDAARHLASAGNEKWTALLNDFWALRGSSPTPEDAELAAAEPLNEFIMRAFLQPYAEFLGRQTAEPPLAINSRKCPRCGSAPLLGVLRPEGDGGKRRLMCSLCLQEWDFRRIFCAACGEAAERKLPVYVAEAFPHVRVECCDTCKSYIRTIDLTKNGNAVPIVDDLATIPLSLWAEEHGYHRIQKNLLAT